MHALKHPSVARKLCGVCVVDARKRWNPTGIVLEAGHQYDFESAPEQRWQDSHASCGPGGYDSQQSSRFERWRRVPYAKWLALVGTIGREPSTSFVIGSDKQNYVPLRSGELHCFANGVWFTCWGNRGSVTLTVYERLAPVSRR